MVAAVLALSIPAHAASRAVKSKVAPVYPELAKRLQISGTVTIEATVEPDGSVSDVKTVSGNHMLSPAAENAVRKWKFEPAAGKTTVDIDVVFAM
ncbi:MAG TPA: energy transducer TonB [Terracidiphilus sp.]|nr:energy transducer TonB [Terracidiphilus sp.]